MSNINRDYLCILDVKTGAINAPKMYFYNTDRSTSNIYVQLVVKETIVSATPIENATDFVIEAKIVKPNGFVKEMTGQLVNEADAIYEFDLPEDFTDLTGINLVEFWVRARVSDREERITSASTKYTVKGSILNSIDDNIKDDNDYPIFLALMERVERLDKEVTEVSLATKALNEEAKGELAKIKADEVEIANNEARRQEQEATRVTNEEARKTEELRRKANETARGEAETARESAEVSRTTYENRRESQERERVSNEYDRQNAEQSREYAEIDRVANEEIRQTNEANREASEEIRKANEQARIAEHTAMRTEHEQTMTAVNEVKAENAILMENDKKQADRMTQVEISDKRQYVIMEGLMNSAGDGYLKIEDTGNDTALYNSVEGFVDVKNITGNTMVNSIKNPDDELTLNADINTSGQSVTLTTAVDNGQVDVLAEGNTMVNVCDQQDPVAITKSYTVETGNHVALQGEYDGKARPVVTGNTLVNLVGLSNFVEWATTYGDNIVCPIFHNDSIKRSVKVYANKTYTIIRKGVWENINYSFFDSNNHYVSGNMESLTYTPSQDGYLQIYFNGSLEDRNDKNIKDIMVLEGDYTNKPIPGYFEGIQSSFEDKLVTQEMVDSGEELAENLGKYRVDYKVTGKNKFNCQLELGSLNDGISTTSGWQEYLRTVNYIDISCFKDVSDFTISFSDLVLNSNMRLHFYDNNYNFISHRNTFEARPSNAKYMKFAFQTPNNPANLNLAYNIQLEEGNTATPYEPYKESIKTYYLNSPLLEGDTIEESGGNVVHVHRSKKIVLDGSADEVIKVYPLSEDYPDVIGFYIQLNDIKGDICFIDKYSNTKNILPGRLDINYEAISVFAGFIKMTILKSKLDTVNLNGIKSYLQNNPITIIYNLNTPTYELISQNDTILTDSYVAGHLDFDSAVPVEKVVFKEADYLRVKYLYDSTEYTVQFESDNIGEVGIQLGSSYKHVDVIKGINKVMITPAIPNNNTLYFKNGIGFSASNIVVTEATDKDFGYFSGMKSVGELEENKIEILSRNKNLWRDSYVLDKKIEIFIPSGSTVTISHSAEDTTDRGTIKYFRKDGSTIDFWHLSLNNERMCSTFRTGEDIYYIYLGYFNNKNQVSDISLVIGNDNSYIPHANNKKQILLNEPLRAVGDTKDRFVQIDGKWYIERNCGKVVLDGSEDWTYFNIPADGTIAYARIDCMNLANGMDEKVLYCDKIKTVEGSSYNYNEKMLYSYYTQGENKFYLHLSVSELSSQTLSAFKAWLQANPLTVVYQLASPTYEPVEIAPVLNTYTDVTHITNNSTIPMNMPIVNSGYELIVKPSTKYTVVGIDSGRIGDSTIVNGTITTPATLDDPFLRPYGTGKTSKVMLLKGEPANIPGYFTGIKSVFEDKVTEDGKYACEVRVYNDLGNETKQTLYLDEPLYNTNNITIYNDKLGYWKNWDKVALDGSEQSVAIYRNQNEYSTISFSIKGYEYNQDKTTGWNNVICVSDKFITDSFNKAYKGEDREFLCMSNTNHGVVITILKSKLATQDTDGLRTWLQSNPVTVVYKLAEPKFIPLIDNCPNFVIGSWDNCSIHFDSIIPLLATRYRYTGNVPSVMAMSNDVATVSDISDQQDSMIIDLATQVATMEMMLM